MLDVKCCQKKVWDLLCHKVIYYVKLSEEQRHFECGIFCMNRFA